MTLGVVVHHRRGKQLGSAKDPLSSTWFSRVLSYTGRSADFSILPCPIQETVRSQSSALKIPEDAGTHMAYAVPCSGIVLLGSLGAEAWIKRLLLPGTPRSPVHRCGICGLAIRSLIRPGTSAPRQQ
ncbi:hypothetical protein DTO164E3_1135 [Paecilomyces variotii]|nr:hypothetical protein DTO032I3_2974 [Paecilomyces variotii]KAJ9205882.1 hypothetical protein DTO164E3_1135 [Paecilomyces variotii]KAJ9236641.1 hypothetical protein DTO169E5_5632 [Paecilomyces variotii]KAJ9250887.1 hypothetical protein DTO207G8_5694 [Paecilomyces variotii]KAJ9273162.1 hypothetical protein DTO212C5_747 [Paecilomyces variotii]